MVNVKLSISNTISVLAHMSVSLHKYMRPLYMCKHVECGEDFKCSVNLAPIIAICSFKFGRSAYTRVTKSTRVVLNVLLSQDRYRITQQNRLSNELSSEFSHTRLTCCSPSIGKKMVSCLPLGLVHWGKFYGIDFPAPAHSIPGHVRALICRRTC